LGLFALSSLAFAANAAQDLPIESFQLKNGMEVVLVSDPSVPAVTHMLWYRVGAADDFPGRSGLAHYNEHMMFQGTEKIAGGEFARSVAVHGGHANAFTSHDYTAYYVSIAREYLPLVMEMEADRMLHMAPSQANFIKEREVIIEERRMSIENQPEALLNEELHALLYRNHPYHTPVIGWMHEMQALSREDVLAFHRQFYQPANAVLVVTGDIGLPELKTLAERYYGGLPTTPAYQRHWNIEPPQRGPRSLTMRSPLVRQPQWTRIYAAPSVSQKDATLVMPIYLVAQILGGGPASRLYQSLVVRQHLATDISADYDGIDLGPGEFSLGATPAEGVGMTRLEAAIDKEIQDFTQDLAEHRLSEEEIARAKTLLKAESIYARDGLEGMARLLGSLIMAHLPPRYFNEWPRMIEAVDAANMREAAISLFRPENSVTGYLLPQEGEAPMKETQ
jgi:zinc protease